MIDKKELEKLGKEIAKGIKSEHDLNEFRKTLTKMTVEAALNAELDDHLGYEKNDKNQSDNSRNGYSSKTIRTEDGLFDLSMNIRHPDLIQYPIPIIDNFLRTLSILTIYQHIK